MPEMTRSPSTLTPGQGLEACVGHGQIASDRQAPVLDRDARSGSHRLSANVRTAVTLLPTVGVNVPLAVSFTRRFVWSRRLPAGVRRSRSDALPADLKTTLPLATSVGHQDHERDRAGTKEPEHTQECASAIVLLWP